jgi:hypothetical protein
VADHHTAFYVGSPAPGCTQYFLIMSTTAKRSVLTVGVGLLGLLAFHFFAPHYSTVVWWEVRSWLYWLLPVVGLFVLASAVLVLYGLTRQSSGVMLLGIVVILGSLVAVGWWTVSTHGYLQSRDYYTASAVTSADPVPTLGQRAPFSVAEAQARPNLGEISGDTVDTTFLPSTGSYSTLVKRRGTFPSGYEAVLDQDVPIAGGRGDGTTCRFDRKKADVLDGGWFSHNLARAIHSERRGVRYDSGDIYAYCDKSTPVVVVPLKRQVGWLVVGERPAGVVILNGKTGDLDFRDTAAGVPGPAYPLSLAARQREALTASGGYWDYRGGRSGWEASEDDTNSGNNTEFVLPFRPAGDADAATQTRYSTMLTGRGSATAISAISFVEGRARSGELAPITVYRTKPRWVSPDAITSRIKADYQDLPNWQNQKVMEVSPVDGSRWVATIGNGQNVLYRVVGSGDLKTDLDPKIKDAQATCLQRADGSTIRCGTLADQGGNGVGVDYGKGPTGQGPGGPTGSDLATLTDQQLADLLRRVAEESARRLPAS